MCKLNIHTCILFLLLNVHSTVFAQIVVKTYSTNIKSALFNDTIKMNGLLDKQNSFEFQHMRMLSISNHNLRTLHAPRIIINNQRNWYTAENLSNETVSSATSTKDSLLSIWKFGKNNRTHYLPANYDDYVFHRMLTIYGYGTCDVITAQVLGIAQYVNNSKRRTCFMPHHTIPEVFIREQGAILDSDIEVFYLKPDNHQLAGIKDVMNDKFLIKRTEHYGPGNSYEDLNGRTLLASLYSMESIVEHIDKPSLNFDFHLKPYESIIFSWDIAQTYYHAWRGDLVLDTTFTKHTISNSKYIFASNFQHEVPLTELFDEHKNIAIQTQPKRFANIIATEDSSYFTYKLQFPFPILEANISGIFKKKTEQDTIKILVTTDEGKEWNTVWQQSAIGSDTIYLSLKQYLQYPLINENHVPTYNYILKFVFLSNTGSGCGVDSLYVENTFQISKFFLPQLKLGENTIEYTDANGNDPNRNVEVSIEWLESLENKPPNKITAPTFPLHQSDVDSLYFAFTWQPATDDDSDEIIDYEFMLSDDERMLFPHSPNFNLYMSAFGEEKIRPYFKVKETGWLNDGETYYWRVRAKDARGAWSGWSDTWSFTPYGVMRPVNGKAEIVRQSIKLNWERNPTGKQPDFYKIYASNETNGFTPDENSFYTITDSTSLNIPLQKDKALPSFWRISACDNNGQESLISDVIESPYPYVCSLPDTVTTGDYLFKLVPNVRYYPFYFYGYDTLHYVPNIKIIKKPDWINYSNDSLFATVDDTTIRKMLYNDSLCKLELLVDDYNYGVTFQTIQLIPAAKNNAPKLQFIGKDSVCYNEKFTAFITSTDNDIMFGDTNYYSILQKPNWLEYRITEDTIYLSGIPEEEYINGQLIIDYSLRVKAVDTKNDSTVTDFSFYLLPQLKVLSYAKDAAIEDSPYSYPLLINRKYEHISFSFISQPSWLQLNAQYQLSGTPSIHNLNDTILNFTAYDNLCKTSVDHNAIISIAHVNHAPVITTTTLPTMQNGMLYHAKIEAFDIDNIIERVDLQYNITPPPFIMADYRP